MKFFQGLERRGHAPPAARFVDKDGRYGVAVLIDIFVDGGGGGQGDLMLGRAAAEKKGDFDSWTLHRVQKEAILEDFRPLVHEREAD